LLRTVSALSSAFLIFLAFSNNAAVSSGKERQLTEDGVELTFATNHLGHFLLTNLLLDNLKKNAPSRIVVVSSSAHIPGVMPGNPPNFKCDLESINNPKNFDAMVVYKNSKLCTVWFTYELTKKLEGTGVTVNAICPGFVPGTDLNRQNPIRAFFVKHIMSHLPYASTEDEGGGYIFDGGVSPTLEGISGKFISKGKETKSSEESHDKSKAKALWDLSESLTKQYL